ncbi:MAG: ATP-binding protein [Bacteroidia bacterium]
MPEKQNTEYKSIWNDDFLKAICGFANANGGRLYIGIDDKGKVVGLKDFKKLMDDIPNKVRDQMGILVDVNLLGKNGLQYLEVVTKPHTVPISFKGVYYYRSGSTNQRLTNIALNEFLLKKVGKTWDEIIEPNVKLADIDEKTVKQFKEFALKRFPAAAKEKSTKSLLEKLGLIVKGEFTRAAVLLFAKDPQKFYISSVVRIGRFKDEATILSMDEITGNLFQQVEGTMEILKKKYLYSEVEFEGLKRNERLEFPEEALREAIVNAIAHRDYSAVHTQFKVYPDRLILWNNGGLIDLTIDELKKKHSSHPRNALIADVFHKAGYIEKWGTGTVKMVSECISAGLPEPIYEQSQGGMQVTFLKDIYTEEFFKMTGLNDRQVKGMLYAKEHGSITNAQYQKITGSIKRTASRDLSELVDNRLLNKTGSTGKGTVYILWGHKGDIGDNVAPQIGDALDKKIHQFENKLNAIDKDDSIQDEFNREVFFKIYDSWLSELLRKLIPIAQKFNKLFKSTNHDVFVINGIGQAKFTNESVEDIIRNLRADCERKKDMIVGRATVELSLSYIKLVKGGKQTFSISHHVRVEFGDIQYKVTMDEFSERGLVNNAPQFEERLLHKPMTKKEIDSLAKKMGDILLNEIVFFTTDRVINKRK